MKSDSASQHFNDANPLKDLTKELEMLQKERIKAIDTCQFSRAQAIDVHIERLRERIEATKHSTNQIQNVLKFELKKEEIQFEAIQKQTMYRENIFAIRKEFQERQKILHQNHANALIQMADEYSASLELESIRTNPMSEDLVRQAKLHAQAKHYAYAESLFNESRALREESAMKRQDEVEKAFNGRKAQLDKKHAIEINLCIEKENAEITGIVELYKKEIKRMRNVLAKAASDLQLEISQEDAAFLDDLTLEDTEIKEISELSASGAISPKTPTKRTLTPTSAKSKGTPNRARTPVSRRQTPASRKATPSSIKGQTFSTSSSKQKPYYSPRAGFENSPRMSPMPKK